jgi:hypothetical protein
VGGDALLAHEREQLDAARLEELADIAFAGLDLMPPGVVAVSEWRPEEVACYGGAGRKPA